jgi:hypothetical protein
MGYFGPDVLIGDACLVLNGSFLHFGVLSSKMHNVWTRFTCGRIKSDFRYSAEIVYNNFPWPDQPTDKQVKTIEGAAQSVLDTRSKFPESSLADLYDPLTMPPALVQAHQSLDHTVDAAYGKKYFTSDAERVAFLFELYRKYTSLLPAGGILAAKRKSGKKRPA